MVFNRKPSAKPPVILSPQGRTGDRMNGASIAHLNAVSETAVPSVIGSDLSIEGEAITIRCQGTLRVLGAIDADVHCKHVEIGRDAVVRGTVSAEAVDVLGRVSGAIVGANVVLHETAVVEGDIHSQLLSIEQGAAFDGRSRRVRDPAEIAPQLERPSTPAPSPSRVASPSVPPAVPTYSYPSSTN
jgi:cytoskeletal protein CcmA (bactofilin family)